MADTSPAARATEFVAVTGSTSTTNSELLLILGYLALWGLVAWFLFRTSRQLKRLEERLAALDHHGRKEAK